MTRLLCLFSTGALLILTSSCGGGSDDEPAGSGGSAGAAGSGGTSSTATGCSAEVKLLERDTDFSKAGPWPVGARTVQIGKLTVEVWYPGSPGSEAGKDSKVYDLRKWLPDSEQGKIPDADNPWQKSQSFADLPLDVGHGPYPAVIFVHGTAGFRTQSLEQMEHWASRGFVVLAADHPGLYLKDLLALNTQRDLDGDLNAMVAALGSPSGELAFLTDRLDATRIGMAGHSAGGGAVKSRGADAEVLMPLAAGGTEPGAKLVSTLVMGGQSDKVVSYADTVKGYEASPAKKRLVGLSGAGHLFPSTLCWLENAAGENIFEVAQKYQVQNANFAGLLFDCPAGQPSETDTRAIVNFATAAALEETLHCVPGDPFGDLKARFSAVGEYRFEP